MPCTHLRVPAESCLASQSVGAVRHGTSPEVDRAMAVLASSVGAALEGPLAPAQRAACIEALLYMQVRRRVWVV